MRLGDVVDQFHNDHGLADAGAAEQPHFSTLGIGLDQVDNLDPGDQNLGIRRLFYKLGRRPVNGQALLGLDRTQIVDRFPDNVHDAAQGLRPHGHGDRATGIHHFLAADQAVGNVHGDRAHRRLAQMLGDLEDHTLAVIVYSESIEDGRQVSLEVHVDDGAHDLCDGAGGIFLHGSSSYWIAVIGPYNASAPEMISISSLVILAWRVRL